MYGIAEMAKKLNLSMSTLRLWDKKGILVAKRTKTNRRVYSQDQFLDATRQKEYVSSDDTINAIQGKNIAIIGGAGYLGRYLTRAMCDHAKKIVIISRDEGKHLAMSKEFSDKENIRYLLGSVEDADRMNVALKNIDICILAAASKSIQSCAYNIEATIKTNVIGALNVMHSCIKNSVKKNIYISTDKVVNCQTCYGAQKMLGEKIFIDGGNNYGSREVLFSAVRYGNILGSSKSFKTFIKEDAEKNGCVKLTNKDATRFWMKIEQAVDIVLFSLANMHGGEVFIPKDIKGASLELFAQAFAPGFPIKEVGFETYEKIHEELITDFEQTFTTDFGKYYVILPVHAKNKKLGWNIEFPEYKPIKKFKYTSDAVEQFTAEGLKELFK